ncbi:MAG: 8-oxo-dGTP diphosphatase MutT [Dongiaceae bacterium]
MNLTNKSRLLVAAAILQDNQARILIAQKIKGDFKGQWEFPGGKIMDGEIPAHALIRELKEELGIIVAPQALEPFTIVGHEYPQFILAMEVFFCRKWRGEIRAAEGQPLAWVEIPELENYPLLAADEPLIPLLKRLAE